jgi:methylated-DNA-[protein]-cysteine S-methyltransferase
MSTRYRIFPTPLGAAAIVATPRGVRRAYLPERSAATLRRTVQRDTPDAAEDPNLRPALVAALQRYYAGEQVDFSDVPIDWPPAGPFALAAWQACRQVPYGETISYLELATRAGSPKAARAAGTAMRHNPVGILVPCHRVIGSRGTLGGFSGPGGLSLKRRLLDMEAATSGSVLV